MIKIEDLKAGETILIQDDGFEKMVLEVFTRTVILSETNRFDAASSNNWHINEINERGWKIKQPKAPIIPDVGNYYETMPYVRVRDNENQEWEKARLVNVYSGIEYCFEVISKSSNVISYNFCELIEEEND